MSLQRAKPSEIATKLCTNHFAVRIWFQPAPATCCNDENQLGFPVQSGEDIHPLRGFQLRRRWHLCRVQRSSASSARRWEQGRMRKVAEAAGTSASCQLQQVRWRDWAQAVADQQHMCSLQGAGRQQQSLWTWTHTVPVPSSVRGEIASKEGNTVYSFEWWHMQYFSLKPYCSCMSCLLCKSLSFMRINYLSNQETQCIQDKIRVVLQPMQAQFIPRRGTPGRPCENRTCLCRGSFWDRVPGAPSYFFYPSISWRSRVSMLTLREINCRISSEKDFQVLKLNFITPPLLSHPAVFASHTWFRISKLFCCQ